MTGSRILYAAIVLAAFIFSQALYDSVSLFTLVCVLLLPLVSVSLLFLGRQTVHIRCKLSQTEMYRYGEGKVFAEIRCPMPLISPIMRINCRLPGEHRDESVPSQLHVSFSPMSTTVIEIPFSFDLRGNYTVGVESVEICDYLRLVRIRKKIGRKWKVRVKPRFLAVEAPLRQRIYLDDGTGTDMTPAVGYATEPLGVRDYIENESLRFVHWNLSAQKDQLMVKTFAATRQKQSYILMDLSAENITELHSRRVGDAVVECALSLARETVNEVGATCLMWNAGGLQKQEIDTPAQLAAAHAAVSMCPLQTQDKLDKILDQIDDVQDLCVVVGSLSDAKMRRIDVLRTVVHCPIKLVAVENTDHISADVLRGKNIFLQVLHLEHIEEGRLS